MALQAGISALILISDRSESLAGILSDRSERYCVPLVDPQQQHANPNDQLRAFGTTRGGGSPCFPVAIVSHHLFRIVGFCADRRVVRVVLLYLGENVTMLRAACCR